MHRKKPLYRKVNTRTHGVRHGDGGEYRWSRNAKRGKDNEATRGSMRSHHQHGSDYTPLFRFLLSRVGGDWAEIHSEAVSRLDQADPIHWIVARCQAEQQPYVRIGEASYFSGLYVDDNNRLALVAPDLHVEDMKPTCSCCTHTFNGVPFVRKFCAD